MRFLKISWTYYGLLLRVMEHPYNGRWHPCYTIKHHTLRELDRDTEEFRAYLDVLEQDLHKQLDEYEAEEKL